MPMQPLPCNTLQPSAGLSSFLRSQASTTLAAGAAPHWSWTYALLCEPFLCGKRPQPCKHRTLSPMSFSRLTNRLGGNSVDQPLTVATATNMAKRHAHACTC
jgi:hypothetical protein